MTDAGWTKLTRNWALFFTASGILNEVVWRNFSTDTWVALDTWGMTVVSILFTASQLPMIMKHQDEPPQNDLTLSDAPRDGAPEA
ncbi:inner membrane-spanning protein YciB [Hankyongella ginsenosidimutans]|uniref:inner membrane-spanning protein YciB n=1 Tax=Hankyongella ginsenosidimutans TaxID=1763828 RepID=UPI001CA32A81|nr:septation protein IspZ [Hankyongella ginsenosidimutans]